MTNERLRTVSPSTIELTAATPICVVPSCGGAVVRHSLGAGQAVRRCLRCFRRYEVTSAHGRHVLGQGRLRRFLDEFVSWRD